MHRSVLYILAWMSVFPFSAWAQDMLYFSDGTIQRCRITAIDAEKVSYKNLENFDGPTYTKNNQQLLFAFKDTGRYIVLADKRSHSASDYQVFMENAEQRAVDIIITKDNAVVAASQLSFEEDKLRYMPDPVEENTAGYLEKKDLAAIIYKDGRHMLYLPTSQVVSKLTEVKDKVDVLFSASAGVPQATQPGMADEAPALLGKAELERFQFKAKEKTDRFGQYIVIIGDKQSDRYEQSKAIDAACGLFLSDTSMVEVSNILRDTKERFTVRKYLQRLKLLPYNEVVITWTDVSYVSDLRLGPDGNYHGVVSFQQIFKGYTDGKPVYEDVTQKNVEVVLKSYVKEIDGEKKQLWDVFLSNVGVEETSR